MRAEGWEARLREAVEAAREKPFEWGAHDCGLFAADCVRAMTGADIAAAFRGKYTTASGSRRALMRLGEGSLAETVTAVLGEPLAPTLARRGDVVLFQSFPPDSPPDGIDDCMDAGGRATQGAVAEALAVCLGEVAAAPGPTGMVYVPLSEWLKAWRV